MKLSRWLLVLKGMAMGAADVVPGVSGGTIAFITGIYEELIDSIKSLNLKAINVLFKEGIASFWKHINGSFLLRLFSGIAISVLSLAKLISYLLDHHPILIWSFFFGLILASILLIGRQIEQWNLRIIGGIVLGTVVSFYVTIATPTQSPDSLPFLFFAGFLAIIAMILPGISGAFILLLLGAYSTVINTINTFREGLSAGDMAVVSDNGLKIVVFMVGCLTGLMAFSRVLSWMFKHYKNTTLALLTGFMIGSLNKIWPWKSTVMTRITHAGKENEAVVPFIQDNVLPWNYSLNELDKNLSVIPNNEPQTLLSILLIALGAGLIILLSKYSPDNGGE